MGPDEIRRLTAEYRQRLFEARQARAATALVDAETDGDGAADDEGDGAGDWKEALLEVLLGMPPDAFERLAQRLLREAGFTSAVVTGRSGDGGIDGLGVYRMSLVSFPVFFQCKRYRGSVGAGAVRDFRGAMAGRGDKGLLITTGTFSADAQREATRDGAPPVDLIDGQRLCDLLKQHAVGVTTTVRQIEDVIVDREYFDRV
jgi:restriction system protein